MPNYKILLGKIKMIETRPGLGHNVTTTPLKVSFADGSEALLDRSQPRAALWAGMLELLQAGNEPAYVETEPDTNIITRLCVPIITEVLEIFPAENGGFEIAFSKSDALHYLHGNVPGFEEFYELLLDAKTNGTKIMVTATAHENNIIDAREAGPLLLDEEPEEPLPPPMPIIPVSPERALELFNLVSAPTCTTDWLESPCITYKYPSSGCNVRAHLMCRLMIAAGATPEKMWIALGLKACTINAPRCKVGWSWHVAPTLLVTQPGGPPKRMIIDPSLCDGPVTEEHWRSLQGNPDATLTPARWELYEYLAKNTATPEKAEREMQKHRIWLAEMWDDDKPPYDRPPYNCPPCKK